ncbi:MAG: serine/threonine-protein kinase, partial [Rhodothermales bacterium]
MIGETISHYQITDQLGQGGMGIVYKATDTRLQRTVALKFLPAHSLQTDDDKQRFEREAKAAAALNHPNIATVYEIDEAGGRTFIAMEFIGGETLASTIKQGPLKLSEAVEVALQVAAGLQAAHEKGIVHRDIKASNVMFTEKGQVKIMDFGLAKTAAASVLTKEGTTVGTAAYMSPE